MKYKKSEIEPILLTISQYSAPKEGEVQKLIGGLLSEDLSLGTKRKLQKIHKKVHESYTEFVEDLKALDGLKNNVPEYTKEIKELLDEEVEIEVEPVSLASIEAISTNNNYDFDIIEKFAI